MYYYFSVTQFFRFALDADVVASLGHLVPGNGVTVSKE